MFQAGSDVVTRKGQAFRCLSGMAICVPVGTLGLMEVDYWGSLTEPAYIELRVSVLAATRSAAALVIRMDNASMLLGQQPTPPSPMKSAGAPAGAFLRWASCVPSFCHRNWGAPMPLRSTMRAPGR